MNDQVKSIIERMLTGGFVFELDEYSLEALGMNEDLANYYYEFIGYSSTNYAFNF